MDLEIMKDQWNKMSEELAQQKLVNKNLVMEMTKNRFRNKISTIEKYEGLGLVICIPAAIFLLFNLYKMDTAYLMVCAIYCIAVLLVLPLLTFKLIGQMKESAISTNSYKQSLLDFAKSRKRFLLIQKSSWLWGILLMIAILPVSNKIGGSSEPIDINPLFYVFGFVYVVVFTRWGYRKYDSMTAQAEELLRELRE